MQRCNSYYSYYYTIKESKQQTADYTLPRAPKLSPLASPKRSIRMMSSPVVSSVNPARQSHSRSACTVVPSLRGTSTPEPSPDPEDECVRADSSMSLPMSEKVLDPVIDDTDFLSNSRGEGGCTYESLAFLEYPCLE